MRVRGRTGQDIFDDAFGQFAGWLVLLQDDPDPHTWFELNACGDWHLIKQAFRKFQKALHVLKIGHQPG